MFFAVLRLLEAVRYSQVMGLDRHGHFRRLRTK